MEAILANPERMREGPFSKARRLIPPEFDHPIPLLHSLPSEPLPCLYSLNVWIS
jgi:hypothetical protein